MSDSSTMYLVPAAAGEYALTDTEGKELATIAGDVFSVLPSLMIYAEVLTGCAVKIVSEELTITRVNGVLRIRPTDDCDDPIINRIARMFRRDVH